MLLISLPSPFLLISFIGADPTIDTLASATPSTSVTGPTVVASPTVVDTAPATTASVPTLHPNLALAPTLPIVLDTGASFSVRSSKSDFLPVAQAPYGLLRSPILVVFKTLATPVDPFTLITGEDVSDSVDSDPIDLSSPDPTVNSDSVYFDIREFGTSSLTFLYSKSTLELLHIFLEPTQVDWLHWIPLPRLILPESYFHIFGLDYLQAIALFHLIPIWIYCVLHFAVNLE